MFFVFFQMAHQSQTEAANQLKLLIHTKAEECLDRFNAERAATNAGGAIIGKPVFIMFFSSALCCHCLPKSFIFYQKISSKTKVEIIIDFVRT